MTPLDERYVDTSIELDCKPGYPRPGDLIESVIKDSGLELSDFDTEPPFFGEQKWVLKDSSYEVKAELFKKAKSIFRERITNLYNSGAIRYGTW